MHLFNLPDRYPEIGLDLPSLAPRTVLFSLPPLGEGSHRESLLHYLSRLAAAHSVSLFKLVRRFMPEVCFKELDQSRVRLKANWMNNKQRLASVFAPLTGQRDLETLSFCRWESVISRLGLYRKVHAWCPLCLAEDAIPYERLSWTLFSYQVCSVHKVPLSEACPTCHKAISAKMIPVQEDLCAHCGSTLAKISQSSLTCTPWQEFVSNSIDLLLAHETGILSREAMPDLLHRLMEQERLVSIPAAARAWGLPESMVYNWYYGASKALSLDAWCRVSFALSIPLPDLLSGQLKSEATCVNKSSVLPLNSSSRALRLHTLRQEVEHWIDQRKLPERSMRQFCRSLKVAPHTLRRYYPDFYQQLITAHQERKRQRSQEKASLLREEIEKAAIALTTENLPVTSYRVKKLLNKRVVLSSPLAKNFLETLCS